MKEKYNKSMETNVQIVIKSFEIKNKLRSSWENVLGTRFILGFIFLLK